MKPVESPNGSQDESIESPTEPMAELANKYSQIMERLGGSEKAVDLLRHQRRCKICHHSDRQAIEHEFLEWRSLTEISVDYDIPDRATIYRHAHATGLFLRRRTFRGALERIMERAEDAAVTASAVVQAVRADARINDDGQWIEPTRTIQVVHTSIEPSPPPAASPSASRSPAPPPTLLLTQGTASVGSAPTPALPTNPATQLKVNRAHQK